MTLLIINKVVCHASSGGALQLKINDLELLPNNTTFNAPGGQDFAIVVDISSIVDLMITLDVYDTAYSTNSFVKKVQMSRGAQMVNVDYNAPTLIGDADTLVKGNYDVFYQITDLAADQPKVIMRKEFLLAKQLVN